MKRLMTVVAMIVASCSFVQSVGANRLSIQVNVPDIQPVVVLSQEFVSGKRSVRGIVVKEINIADPRNHIGTVLTSSDGRFATLVENIRVKYKLKTAVFTAHVATFGTSEANKSDITAGNVTISYERKEGAWQFKSIALASEVIPSR